MSSKVLNIDAVPEEDYELLYDNFLTDFLKGIRRTNITTNTKGTTLVRGVGGKSQKAYRRCWELGQKFYAIDTGYFGNFKHKTWHRITCDALQNMEEFIERPDDRLRFILKQKSWQDIFVPFTSGRKIIVCPPSNKVMNMFHQPDAEIWTEDVVTQLRTLTDRPIEVRLKPSRFDRVSFNTMQQALADDVHCLITYNSIAATEALMNGKAAISLGPNAASRICETDLKNIDNPRIPTEDEMYAFLTHLSFSQFTQPEMLNGTAWKILQDQM
jgi:hypothetical protein|tara:strand:+ start:131 stop:943 length:813 start_codon:yes stop_codon:yes gene_type:complete